MPSATTRFLNLSLLLTQDSRHVTSVSSCSSSQGCVADWARRRARASIRGSSCQSSNPNLLALRKGNDPIMIPELAHTSRYTAAKRHSISVRGFPFPPALHSSHSKSTRPLDISNYISQSTDVRLVKNTLIHLHHACQTNHAQRARRRLPEPAWRRLSLGPRDGSLALGRYQTKSNPHARPKVGESVDRRLLRGRRNDHVVGSAEG